MNTSTHFKSTETFFSRLTPSFLKPSLTTEQKVDKFAGQLDDEVKDQLDLALSGAPGQAKAKAFAEAVEAARGESDVRQLYAATLKGMRAIRQESDAPVLELTAAAASGAAYALPSAQAAYLGNLTEAACIGLKAYAENPSAPLVDLAMKLDDKVEFLLDDMSPTLAKYQPELALPLEVLQIGVKDAERHGSLYSGISASPWLNELTAMPEPSVPKAFYTLLKDGHNDFEDFQELLTGAFYGHNTSPEIVNFADNALNQISDGADLNQLLQEWKVS